MNLNLIRTQFVVVFEFLVHGLECVTSMTKRRGCGGDEAVVDEGENSTTL